MFFQNKKFVFLFVLLLFYAQGCLSPFEPDGACSKCLPTENLQNRSCFLKVRGCLSQKALVCLQCQSGYILSQNLCIRQAQYFNLTTLIPSPQKIEESKISQSQITPVMVGGFKETNNLNSPAYIQAKTILYKQYPGLSGFKIYKVQEQLVNGINYIFYIINFDNNDLYLAKVYVTFQLQASVSQIYKNNVSIKKGIAVPNQVSTPIPGGWQQFMNVSDPKYTESLTLIQNTFSGLDSYKLSRVQYQIVAGILFAFFYNNDTKNNIFTVEVYKPFYGQAVIQNTWGQKPNKIQQISSGSTDKKNPVAGGSQTISTFDQNSEPLLSAKSALLKVFPNFDVSLVKSISQQVVAGYNVFVSFTLRNSSDVYDVQVFIPLAYTGDQPTLTSIKRNGVIYDPVVQQKQVAGGFDLVPQSDYLIEPFLTVISTIENTFSQFTVSSIKKVQRQLVAGWNYFITFTLPNSSDIYQVTVYIPLAFTGVQPSISSIKKNSLEQDISSFSLVNQTASPGFLTGGYSITTDFTSSFYIKAKSTLFSEYDLQNLTLSKVQEQVVSGKNYRFTFVNQTNSDTYLATVYVTLAIQATVQEITKNNVSIKKTSLITANQTVSLVPQSQPQNQNSLQTTNTGSNQDVSPSQYNSQKFLPVIQAIKNIVPNFDTKLITKVTKQIVAGWNYFITFSLPNSPGSYQIKVYQPLPYAGLSPSVESAKKNGASYDLSNFLKVTSNQIYSWQNDTVFTELYKFFKKQINVNNLLPILSVSKQKKQNNSVNWFQYKIIYSKQEFAACRYYQDFQIFEVTSYVIAGTEMYSVSGHVGYGVYDRTQNVLSDKIKGNDLKKFGKLMIKDISVTKLSEWYRIYKINGYTSEGHFQLILLDRGELSVIQTKKLDSMTCYSIDYTRQVQYRQEYIIDQIRNFMFAKYNLTGFDVTLALASSSTNTANQYLILLARTDLKKVRVLVEDSNDKFVIRKIDVLNDGLSIISDAVFQKAIEDLARKQYSLDLSGFQKINVASNGTLHVAKFASDSSLATYVKFSSNVIGVLSKQPFTKLNPCLSVKPLTFDTCQKCNDNDFLWKGKCYPTVPNCSVQVGNICTACDKYSIESNGKCLKDCSDLFSL